MQVANCPKCGSPNCVVEVTGRFSAADIPVTAGFWCLNCNVKWLPYTTPDIIKWVQQTWKCIT